MINQLFYNKHKKILPIVLTDCLLFVGLKYFIINKAYIFIKNEKVSISETGDLWIKGHKKSDLSYSGFFSSNNSLELINLDDSEEGVCIIGYEKSKRYQLLDVVIGDSTFSFDGNFAAKFRFYEYKITNIK